MFYVLIVPAVRGKCQGFVIYRQTWQCNENKTDCGGGGGERAVVLPTGCPCSAGLLAGICRTKVKVPAIPRGWGPWLQMTSALLPHNTHYPVIYLPPTTLNLTPPFHTNQPYTPNE